MYYLDCNFAIGQPNAETGKVSHISNALISSAEGHSDCTGSDCSSIRELDPVRSCLCFNFSMSLCSRIL